MATVRLFWDANMAVATPFEDTQLVGIMIKKLACTIK